MDDATNGPDAMTPDPVDRVASGARGANDGAAAASDDLVHILLVDDQPANLDALEASLESTGCRFVLARSADEALLALLEQDFAAIVLDVRMPGMGGLELAKMIKRRQRTRHVPILFLTAYTLEDEDVREAYAAGAVDYMTKPIDAEVLRAKIDVFVDLYRHRRVLARTNTALEQQITERHRIAEELRTTNLELESRVQERTAALRDADRRKDEFLATLAHELRNPLAALRFAAEMLHRKVEPGSDLARTREVIDRQLRHLTRLTDDLLDINRITRDQIELQKDTVELHQVISSAVETVRPIVERNGHVLTVEVPRESIPLHGDPVRLSQIFANLLDNAAKYTQPGGRIRLAVKTDHGHARVSVSDTGMGISREALPTLFELFAQGDRPPGSSYGGLGIGLALVRRLVEMHGGTVAAQSEGPGRGAEFVVELPVVTAGAAHDAVRDGRGEGVRQRG
jgi:signal transduction histidine kinase